VIEYTLKKYTRSRRVRIRVRPGGEVLVTAPARASRRAIDAVVAEHAGWIAEQLKAFSGAPPGLTPEERRRDYLRYKERARDFVKRRLEHFNRSYGLAYRRISIKDQKTRWGSCSRHGNLNFNYKIVLLPPEQADYIIVHELCHLKELNHSRRFWDLVARAIPNYEQIKRDLAKQSLDLA